MKKYIITEEQLLGLTAITEVEGSTKDNGNYVITNIPNENVEREDQVRRITLKEYKEDKPKKQVPLLAREVLKYIPEQSMSKAVKERFSELEDRISKLENHRRFLSKLVCRIAEEALPDSKISIDESSYGLIIRLDGETTILE